MTIRERIEQLTRYEQYYGKMCERNDGAYLKRADVLAVVEEDGEPVTEEWLAEIGFVFTWQRWRLGSIALEVVAWHYNDRWYFGICGEAGETTTLPSITTRTSVLNLLAALGIKE